MRIAAISDVHGNVLALDAVLADIAAQDVDVVVAAAIAEGNGRPDVAHALRTGRVDPRPAA
jgi:Icc-related predicted phosphoesterase